MDKAEIERLKFRRQYLLLPKKIECPFIHEMIQVSDKYFLYYHSDLKITVSDFGNMKVILLGDLFDYENPSKDNKAILDDLFDCDYKCILEKSAKYCGRFVVIFVSPDGIMIFHDAMAARKVFYCKKDENLWIASQSHLLAKILNLSPTNDCSKLAYYNSPDLINNFSSNICDSTYYDDILQLMPNHYLDVRLLKVVRYWPNHKIKNSSPHEIASLCAKMVQGYIQGISSRYDVMLPVTAGKDSRTLFAATSGIRNHIYYYLNKEMNLDENSPDIKIPQKLLTELNLDFHILDPYIPVDKDFQQVFFENNPFGSKSFLPIIYNYYLNFSEKVNLPGNNASAGLEDCLNFTKSDVTIEDLLELTKFNEYIFAKELYNKWLINCKDICLHYELPILSLFYWENRLTNMILQVQLDKDIAQEEFSPFNSRQIIATLLSTKVEDIVPPNFTVYKEIMQILWPEVLNQPINPSFKSSILKIFANLGLLNTSYLIKNKIIHLKPVKHPNPI